MEMKIHINIQFHELKWIGKLHNSIILTTLKQLVLE